MAKHTCDGCDKERSDVRSVGRDANGEPDAPDLCFICRKEDKRGKVFSHRLGRYIHYSSLYPNIEDDSRLL